MRVYLFDVDSGLYAGEDFCELKEVQEEDGITILSPPTGQPGVVPVFDRNSGNWKLVPGDSLEKRE
ncbi:hypothetical protein OR1_03042 [Geobacter sp. OR-1]|uniref:hypothetical protein n=1 Tax=Geobacter sp. OR-1 TaxID=1266765 RepID=UPI00054360F0|nr:hypothetical protein [Geobacter sp. OR-1]GAM10745.1 hypothetical protein OR1_03042 [Geobacter sp. OR-1]